MKRKGLLFLVVIVGIFIITGCGKISKEDLIKKADKISYFEMTENIYDNFHNAKNKYEGKSVNFAILVDDIGNNYITNYLSNGAVSIGEIKIYMDDESLSKIKKNKMINIVGKIDSINKDSKSGDINVIIKNGFYISNEVEITGIANYCPGYDGYCLEIDSDVYEDLEYIFNLGDFTSSQYNKKEAMINNVLVKAGDTITITGEINSEDGALFVPSTLSKIE